MKCMQLQRSLKREEGRDLCAITSLKVVKVMINPQSDF